jgi:copper chaperone CopZ
MESIELTIPSLTQANQRIDLRNALVGVNGIESVTIDEVGHVVFVDYDPEFGHPDVIRHSVEAAGYPVTAVREPSADIY